MVSVALGRPCAIQDEELASPSPFSSIINNHFHSFDLSFPIECDDEYWVISEQDEEPSKHFSPIFLQQPVVFNQPVDKPSLIAAFISGLKLNKVLAVLVRTIVNIHLLFSPMWSYSSFVAVLVKEEQSPSRFHRGAK